jgi:hypothetical protein
MRSKAVFTKREDAEVHIAEFREACIDETQVESALPDGLEIKIVEMELYD